MPIKRDRAAPMAPDDRRRAIIEATVPLVIEHGAAVTTRQIAEAAGIAEGTIFRVFDDKRALLLAVGAETMNPAEGPREMGEALAAVPTLYGKVVLVTEQMRERMQLTMHVMMALRSLLLTEANGGSGAKHDRPGPPAFVTEANQVLVAALATHVFEPHRAELAVTPDRAALVLRSLVFGAWHPGMDQDHRLSADDIAEMLLHGVQRSTHPGGNH